MFSEVNASISDILGTKANSYEEKIKNARELAIQNLIEDCIEKHGNAIIGLDFDYIVFQNNLIGVIADGIAAQIEAE